MGVKLEYRAKVQIALALIGFGITVILFNLLSSILSLYGARQWPFSSGYSWPLAREWLGQMSIILGFLIFTGLILNRGRLQRIVQLSFIFAIILRFVGNMGIDFLQNDFYSYGHDFDIGVYAILSLAANLGTILALSGVVLIFYSVASGESTSKPIK